MEESVATPKRKSRKSKSKPSKKSRRRRSKTPKKTPIVKQAGSPSLPVDRTQSPTMPSTQPTPDFPNDPLTNAQAESSQYNKRDYLKRSEAPVPGSARSRSRSRPIVDEVDDYKLQTESLLCFTQRNGRLDDHHHWMITDRINLTRPHTISVAERTLLKAAPKDAPELADIVLDEAEKGMAPFLEGRPIDWTESHLLWTHFNALETPISASYIAIYRLMPSLFKLETPSLADPLVRKMPITGLYTLLLDRQFPRTFRVNLAAEIR
uniref:MRG domain-containing protein n=1 Tax=Panagrellus redivivus TaxID=6233 RepID=A0A7E4VBA2_PANRE